MSEIAAKLTTAPNNYASAKKKRQIFLSDKKIRYGSLVQILSELKFL